MPSADERQRYLRNRQSEVDSAAQYRAMAANEADPVIAQIYCDLAAVEERHATFWEERLTKEGYAFATRRPSWRARVLTTLAHRMGAAVVLPTVAAREALDRNGYLSQVESAKTN